MSPDEIQTKNLLKTPQWILLHGDPKSTFQSKLVRPLLTKTRWCRAICPNVYLHGQTRSTFQRYHYRTVEYLPYESNAQEYTQLAQNQSNKRTGIKGKGPLTIHMAINEFLDQPSVY